MPLMRHIPLGEARICAASVSRRRLAMLCALMLILSGAPQAIVNQLRIGLAAPIARVLETWVAQAPPASIARIDGIIVLGGSSRRLREALKLAALHPDAAIVLSGPGDDEVALARSASAVAGRLEIDRRARNTYENALYSKDLVRPRDGECWAVVTSALHMPRAVGVFSAVGFPVMPWAVGDTSHLPNALASTVWHEVLGLIGYRALGRTRELLPEQPADVGCQERGGA